MVDTSGAIVALTNTVLETLVLTSANTTAPLTTTNGVPRGCRINGIYLSLFFAQDVNAAASAVPLMDWYIIIDKGGRLNITPTFGDGANDFPTPGSTGSAINKNSILHEEKGLIGEKNDGSKMVFQGVITIPRGKRNFMANDQLIIVARANDEAIFCLKSIYKWYI